MNTESELRRENLQLREERDILELRQENRELKRQVERLKKGKKEKRETTLPLPSSKEDWIAFGCILACWVAIGFALTS